jgi:hypothetical protein
MCQGTRVGESRLADTTAYPAIAPGSRNQEQEKRPLANEHCYPLRSLVKRRPDNLQAAGNRGPQGQLCKWRECAGAFDVLVVWKGDSVAGLDQARLDEEGAVNSAR